MSLKTVKSSRYQIWSTKTIVLVSLPMAALTAVLVFWLSKSSAWIEWQLTLLALSVCLFTFLTVGLYRGVRLERPEPAKINPSGVGPVEILPGIPGSTIEPIHVDLPGLPDSGDDLAGCLVSLATWLIATILVAFIVWLAAQILIIGLPALLLGTYWVYYRALRIVFTKSRACKGKIRASLGNALLYTTLYMGWLFAATWLGWFLILSRQGG